MQLQTCIIHTACEIWYLQHAARKAGNHNMQLLTCHMHLSRLMSCQLPGGNANHLGIVRERQQQIVCTRSSPEDKTANVGNPRCAGETICLPFQIGTLISVSWLGGGDINYSYRHPDLTCAGISNAILAIIVFTGTTASPTNRSHAAFS